jgi:hypothetical protein
MDDHTTYVTIGTGIDAVHTIVCTAPVIPDEHGYIKPLLGPILSTVFGSDQYEVLNEESGTATVRRKY